LVEDAQLQPDQRQLDELLRQIVAEVHPLKVILFGSAARGDAGPESDLDVLVVMPEGTHRRHVTQRLYRAIRGITVPYDLVVATPGDLEKHRDTIGLIYREILQEGKTLYAA
jgi:predicted nucleotidyltransferase